MTIRLNGKVVERISRNDLHNTFSVKHHKPRFIPSYKNLYRNQLSTNKGLLIANGVLAFLILGVLVGCNIRVSAQKTEIEALKRQIEVGAGVAANYADYTAQLETELASCSAKLPKPKTFKGKVSYYSADGCLGCRSNQITASGEPFDENKYTMAIPVEWKHIPMGTIATAKNLDNGKTITLKINDRGGFLKYGRVADLSKAAYLALGAKTDQSIIEISY